MLTVHTNHHDQTTFLSAVYKGSLPAFVVLCFLNDSHSGLGKKESQCVTAIHMGGSVSGPGLCRILAFCLEN